MSQTPRFSVKQGLYEFITNFGSLCGWLVTFIPKGYFVFSDNAVPAYYFIYYLFQRPHTIYTTLRLTPIAFKFAMVCFFYLLYCFIYLGWNRIKHKKLVTTGPYKRMRHPQYLAILGLMITMTLSVYFHPTIELIWPVLSGYKEVSNFMLLLILGAQILVYTLLIILEEFTLKQRFNEEYILYRAQTWLIFPKFKITKKGVKRTLPIILGWTVFLCTGMPVRVTAWSGSVTYIAIKPLGYILYIYILEVYYYKGLIDYLLSYWLYWSILLIALIAIVILIGIQRFKTKHQKRMEQNFPDSDKVNLIQRLSLLSYLLFIGFSLVLNFISLIFRSNFPIHGSWEISNVWLMVIIFGQFTIYGGLIYVNHVKQSVSKLSSKSSESKERKNDRELRSTGVIHP